MNVPFAIADATALTEAGYVGEDVENRDNTKFLMVLKKLSNNVWVKKSSDLVKIIRRLTKTAHTCKKSSLKTFKNLVLSLS
ncbi:ATP-dependent protease ATP-binding subunit [Streptococcus pneumoniae]|nr:ATP-dependent protease ATP-binding subunit [Streptococcus pneumoniae]